MNNNIDKIWRMYTLFYFNVTGAPYKYNNFKGDYAKHTSTDHKLNDCVIMKQGGEWTDVGCGVTFFLGTGFGEKHPYICQYS
jgi:hypothetical protein